MSEVTWSRDEMCAAFERYSRSNSNQKTVQTTSSDALYMKLPYFMSSSLRLPALR